MSKDKYPGDEDYPAGWDWGHYSFKSLLNDDESHSHSKRRTKVDRKADEKAVAKAAAKAEELGIPKYRFDGTFKEARREAKRKNKWVLVNINDLDDDLSAILNEQVFNNDLYQEIINDSFVLCQFHKSGSEGVSLTVSYELTSFPYLGVFHPESGERMKQFAIGNAELWPFFTHLLVTDLLDFLCEFTRPNNHSVPKPGEYVEKKPLRSSSSGEWIRSSDCGVAGTTEHFCKYDLSSIKEDEEDEKNDEKEDDILMDDELIVIRSASMVRAVSDTTLIRKDQEDKILMSKHKWKEEVVIVVRHDFIELFGLREYEIKGNFVDKALTNAIFSFANFVAFPERNHELAKYKHWIRSAVISMDNKYFFSASTYGNMIHWDLEQSCMVKLWSCFSVLCMDNYMNILVTGCEDKMIRVWDVNEIMHEPFEPEIDLDASDDDDEKKKDEMAVELSEKAVKKVHNEAMFTLKGHTEMVTTIKFNPHDNGQTFISGSDDCTIRLWSTNDGSNLRCFFVRDDCLSDVVPKYFNANAVARASTLFVNDMIIHLSTGQTISVWDPLEKEAVYSANYTGTLNNSLGLLMNNDQSMLCVLCLGSIVMYEWPLMKINRVITGDIQGACFYPSHPHILAVTDKSGLIDIIHCISGDTIYSVKEHTDSIRYLIFSDDGSKLISVSYYDSIHISNVFDTIDNYLQTKSICMEDSFDILSYAVDEYRDYKIKRGKWLFEHGPELYSDDESDDESCDESEESSLPAKFFRH